MLRQFHFAVFCFALLPLFAFTQPVCDSTLLPNPLATVKNLTCADPLGAVTGSPSASITHYAWTGPAGFESDERVNEVTLSGDYVLVVTHTSGCTRSTTVMVSDLCYNSQIYDFLPYECEDIFAPTPAETCYEACIAACFGQEYYGSTAGFAGDFPQPGWCSNIQNDQWYAFMATQSTVKIKATPYNCTNGDGIQIAIYDHCDNVVDCNAGGTGFGNTPVEVTASGLIPGRAYYIIIDGYSGDFCDFLMEAEGINAFCPCNDCGPPSAPPVTVTPPPTVPVETCPYGSIGLGINVPSNAILSGFYWTGPPGTTVNGLPLPVTLYNPEGKQINIQIGDVPGKVCVRALTYFATPSPPLCIDFQFSSPSNTILPPVTVCNEDIPYVTPWGEEVYISGNYVGFLTTQQGCDSVVQQKVVVLPFLQTVRMATICKGDTYPLGNMIFSESGLYDINLTSSQGCDSLVVLSLTVLESDAKIIAPVTALNCGQTSLVLGSAPTTGSKLWRKLPGGQVVGAGNQLTVNQPGMYTLTVNVSQNGATCTDVDTIVITQGNTGAIPVAVSTQILNPCPPFNAVLSVTSSAAIPNYLWQGPGGFSAIAQSISVNAPGAYTVTVTETTTGCTGTATANFAPVSNLTVSGTLLFICRLTPLFEATSNAIDPSYNLELDSNNIYHVIVTDNATGCTASAVANIILDQEAPQFTTFIDDTLTCATPEVQIGAVPQATNTTFSWAGPNNYLVYETVATVTAPGIYTVTATNPLNSCTSSQMVTVLSDQTPPSFTTFTGQISCDSVSVSIGAVTSLPNAVYAWSGPGNFTSTSATNLVTVPGDYAVTVTDPSNGCSTQDGITVTADLNTPVLELSQTIPQCNDSLLILNALSVPGGLPINWTGPNGATYSGQTITVLTPGTYTVQTTSANGCTTVATMEVIPVPESPEISLTADTITCTHPFSILEVNTNALISTYFWTGPHGFESTLSSPVADSMGVYVVTVTADNGCTATGAVTVINDCTTGVADLQQRDEAIWVFPVPSSGQVSIRFPGEWLNEPVGLQLLDSHSRRVWENAPAPVNTRIKTFDWSGLPAGVYQLQVQGRQMQLNFQVVLLR